MADNDDHGSDHGGDDHLGATVLLTRPRAQSASFSAQLRARLPDVRVVIAPLMEIVPTGCAPELAEGDGVIFSSANGVAAAGPGRGRKAWCVGERTAAAAREANYDACAAGRTADELVANLQRSRPSGRLVHLHGAHTRGGVAERLAEAGLPVAAFAVYDQVALPPGPDFAAALDAMPLIVPLFSPRSAVLFAEAAADTAPGLPHAALRFVALSPAVRDALPSAWHGASVICQQPDVTAMLDGIARQVYRSS